MAVICTDPGHGGSDPGAIWLNVKEKDINLRCTKKLNDLLKNRGHTVYTTRSTDQNVPSLRTRCALINSHHRKSKPRFDAIISVHCNVACYQDEAGHYLARKNLRGLYIIHSSESRRSTELGLAVINQFKNKDFILSHGGMISTVELGRSLAWIHQTLPPAILIELGYMTNDSDMKNLKDKDFMDRVVKNIAEGLDIFEKNTN